mmetsp:Transcript_16154/g.40675  ORF Transcript_16154/g.40675 Transcript_16154/m.40675 type:complete len:590 (-) Transcript_16154:265-2034(-)
MVSTKFSHAHLLVRVRLCDGIRRAENCDLQWLLGQSLAERGEIFARGREHLVSVRLPLLRGKAGEVPRHRAKAFAVRSHRLVQVPNRPHNRLLERFIRQLERRQHIGALGVDVERALQVGVAVRREGQRARHRVERAPAAVRAAHHAHIVPQVPARQEARDDIVRAHAHRLALLEHRAARRDVVDLRGDREGLVGAVHQLDRLQPRGPRRRGRRLLRQLVHQGVHVDEHLLHRRRVDGQVDQHVVLREDLGAHALEAREQRGPVLLGEREHLLHRLVVAHAARHLAHHADRRLARGEARAGERVARRDEGRLEARARLREQLHHLVLRVELRVAEHLVHQLEHVGRLLDRPLGADGEAVHGAHRVGGRHEAVGAHLLRGEGGDGEAPRARADAALQRDGVELRGAALDEEAREERHEGDLVELERREVEQHVGVHDPRRRQRVRQQHAAAGERLRVDRDLLHLPLEVGEPHAGDGREVGGGVLLELRRLERGRRRDHLRDLLLRQLRLDGGEARLFLRGDLVAERRVRLEHDRRAVVVLHDQLGEKVLEDLLARREAPLQLEQRLLEAKRVKRRALGGGLAVDPPGHHR